MTRVVYVCEECGWVTSSPGKCTGPEGSGSHEPLATRAYTPANELPDFLEAMHWVMPNLNDTFAYATADSEKLYMDGPTEEGEPVSNLDMLVTQWRRFGIDGLRAYCARVRGRGVIAPLVTAAYSRALEAMEGWDYERD